MKEDKIISWLKEKQNEIQEQYRKLIKKGKGYDYRGIWIHLHCGCGQEYPTPFYVRPNGRCWKCNKQITTFQKVKEELKK